MDKSHEYIGRFNQEERDTLDALMVELVDDLPKAITHYNYWIFFLSGNSYWARRYSWPDFDIVADSLDEFVFKIKDYYGR